MVISTRVRCEIIQSRKENVTIRLSSSTSSRQPAAFSRQTEHCPSLSDVQQQHVRKRIHLSLALRPGPTSSNDASSVHVAFVCVRDTATARFSLEVREEGNKDGTTSKRRPMITLNSDFRNLYPRKKTVQRIPFVVPPPLDSGDADRTWIYSQLAPKPRETGLWYADIEIAVNTTMHGPTPSTHQIEET